MLASSIPVKFPIPFANSAGGGFIRPIPVASQIPITPGAASLTDGFPPLNFQPEGSGGIPPFGQDFNGILNQITAWSRWAEAGAPITYDSAFSTAIGGYPRGALIYSTAGNSWWLSQADNNTSNPDTGGANWLKIGYGLTHAGNPNGSVAGTAATNNALTTSLLFDTSNQVMWICEATGDATHAQWAQLTGLTTGGWCGTSGGTPNAQVLTTTGSFQSFPTGMQIRFIVGPGPNTGPTTIAVGSLGTFAARRDGPLGPIALVGGEFVPGNVMTGNFDGTFIHLNGLPVGTISSKNVGITVNDPGTGSLETAVPGDFRTGPVYTYGPTDRGQLRIRSNGGALMADTLPAKGSVTVGYRVEVLNHDTASVDTVSAPLGTNLNGVNGGSFPLGFGNQSVEFTTDINGDLWVTNVQGARQASPEPVYINASASVGAGRFVVDTSGGPISLTLDPTAVLGDTVQVIDFADTFSNFPCTITGGLNLVNGVNGAFILDVSGTDILFGFKNGNWS